MATLGQTTSVCGTCGELVPARIVVSGNAVSFRKFCREHGETIEHVHGDADEYLASQRFVKPAWMPAESHGDASAPCPQGCGMCSRHEQHLCLPIIEITSRCDLSCPVCLVSAGREWDMSLQEFERILDGLIRAERRIDVLNLSGGEPTRHPEFLGFVDAALARPEIVRVSVSTNGLRFLEDPALLRELFARRVVVSLQFDGFEDRAYEVLRGRRLLAEKQRILGLLAESGVSTSLTMTLAKGVNEGQLRPTLDYLFSHEHVVSLMVQPLAFAGRGASLQGKAGRLSAAEAGALLGAAGHRSVRESDFVALPCSHPLCFRLAFYLMLDGGGAMSVTRLAQAGTMLDTLANRTIFGLDAEEHARLKELVYELWSGPAGSVPEGPAVLDTLRRIVRDMGCGCFDPRDAFLRAERRVKSVFIHAFQDAATFDLARVRRCCNGYPQTDGRVIPACVRNVCRPGVGFGRSG